MIPDQSDKMARLLDTIVVPTSLVACKDHEILQKELNHIIGELKSHNGPVLCLAITSDDQYFLSGSTDKSVILWDLNYLKNVFSFKSHLSDVNSLSISQDNQYFLSGSSDCSLKLWNLGSRSLIRTLVGHTDKVTGVSFIKLEQIVSCSWDKLIKLWTFEGELVRNLEIHTDLINDLRVSLDYQYLFTISSDKTAKCFNLFNYSNEFLLGTFESSLTCLDANLNYVACAAGSLIKVWNLDKWSLKSELIDSRTVKCLKFTNNSKYLLACSDSFYMTIWNLEQDQREFGLSYYPNSTFAVTSTSDSQKIITGLNDKTIKIFNTVSRRDNYTLFAHKAEINEIKATKCGTFLISASNDSTVKVWNIESKQEVMAFGTTNILCADLSGDNQLVVCGHLDSTIRIWDQNRKKLVNSFKIGKKGVKLLTVNKSLEIVASAFEDDSIILIWEMRTGKILNRYYEHNEKVTSLIFVKNYLVSSSKENKVLAWDSSQNTGCLVLKQSNETVACSCKSGSEDLFALGFTDYHVELWETETFTSKFSVSFKFFIVDICISQERNTLFVALSNKAIKGLSLENNSELFNLPNPSPITKIGLLPDLKSLVVSSEDSNIYLWSLESNKNLSVFSGHTLPAFILLISSDSFFSISADQSIRRWKPNSKTPGQTINSIYGKFMCIEVLHINKIVLAGNDIGEVRIFNLHDQNEEPQISAHNKPIRCITASSNNLIFATGGNDGVVKLWDFSTRSLKFGLAEQTGFIITSLAFTEDSSYIISGTSDKSIKMWSLETRNTIHVFLGHTQGVSQIKVIADKLYSASSDKTTRIWNITERKLEFTSPSSAYSLNALDVHTSQKFAIWADFNKLIVWNLENSRKHFGLEGHLKENIKSVLFSPNGKYIISASKDGSIKFWDIKNMCESQKLEGCKAAAIVGCTNKEKNLIYFGLEDGSFSVYDTEHALLLNQQSHVGAIRSIGHNSKYNLLVTGGRDKVIKVWDMSTNFLIQTLEGHTDIIRCLLFDQKEEILVSGSWDKTIKLWDIHSYTMLQEFTSHTSSVMSLTLSHENILISGSGDKLIKFWDLDSMTEIFTLSKHKKAVTCLKLNSDNTTLASGSQDNSIVLWDVLQKTPVGTLEGHSKEISGLCFINQDTQLASSSFDRYIFIWELSTFRSIYKVCGHNSNIFDILEFPKCFLTMSGDKSVKYWDCSTYTQIDTLCWPAGKAKVIKRFKDGFYVGLSSGAVCEFSVFNQKISKCYWVSSSDMNDFAIDQTGSLIVAGSADRSIKVFNLATEESVCSLLGHTNTVTAVIFTNDSKFVVSGSADSSIKVWNLSSKSEEYSISGHRKAIQSLNCVAGTNWIISTSFDRFVKIWDLDDRSELMNLFGHSQGVTCSLLIKNESLLATGSKDCSIKIWDFLNAKEIFFLVGHSAGIVALSESEDQERIISVAEDVEVKVWNFTNKCEEFSFRAHSQNIISMSIWGNEYILTGCCDGSMKLWDLKSYNTSNSTLKTLTSINVANSNWNVKHTFDPFVQDKLGFYNLIDSIKWKDYSNLSNTSVSITLTEYKFTIIHILCFLGQDANIEPLLNASFKLKPDVFNRSPIYYAIFRKRQSCVDLLLNYLSTSVGQSETLESFSNIYAIRHDFPMIISNSSVNLNSFLNVLLYKGPATFVKTSISLPNCQFSLNFIPNIKEFSVSPLNAEVIPVHFNYSLIELPSQVGSASMIELLTSISECTDSKIYNNELIQTYIQYQWDRLRPWIAFFSILLFTNLIMILVLIHDNNTQNKVCVGIYIFINVFLIIWEVIQVVIQRLTYFKDLWNLLDFVRILISIIWIFAFPDLNILTWFVILLSFFRGLTAFRLFDGTRYYVRLILRTLNDAKYFGIMLCYSIITFGALLLVAEDRPILITFETLWMFPYKLNFGNYEPSNTNILQDFVYIIATMVNIIVMLNLLVSILGDSHDQFQIEKNIIDYKEKADLCLEIEQIMFWKRNTESFLFLHVLKHFSLSGADEGWDGRMVYLEKKIDTIGMMVNESQAKTAEGINEKINTSRELLVEKLDKFERNCLGQEKSGNGDVLGLIKVVQDEMEMRTGNLEKRMNDINKGLSKKIEDIDEKVSQMMSKMEDVIKMLGK